VLKLGKAIIRWSRCVRIHIYAVLLRQLAWRMSIADRGRSFEYSRPFRLWFL